MKSAVMMCAIVYKGINSNNWHRSAARLVLLVLSISPFFVALQAIAQVESEVPAETETLLTLSASVGLSGYEQYRELRDELAKTNKRQAVYITMPNDQGSLQKYGASEDFLNRLGNEDPSGLFAVLKEWNLEFKYPLEDRTVNLGVREEATSENLLFRAAMTNDLDIARYLLDNYTVDVNSVNEAHLREVNALIPAVTGEHAEMVELLLNAGADPNLKPKGRRGPLTIAILNKDIRSTRALFEAGASLDGRFKRRGLDKGLFEELIQENNVELVSLLLENGLETDPRGAGFGEFTPLMSALLDGRSEMALMLLAYSDPSTVSEFPLYREQSGIDDIAILPPANALFLAQLRSSQLNSNIVPAIEQRLTNLGGEEAVLSSRIQAAISMSDYIYLEGDLVASYDILDKALSQVSLETITTTSNAELFTGVGRLLLRKHELDVINDTTVSARDREFIKELALLDDSTGHRHAMLDMIKQTLTDDYEPLLEAWKNRYAGQRTIRWDYSRLNSWIRSLDNEENQKRLFRALDYFEFNLSDRG